MNRLERGAVLCHLAEALRKAGSWCGETHLQKALFLLEEGRGVPLDHNFVLYKYGPFSFDLREELGELRAEDFLQLEPPPPGYGPRLQVGRRGGQLESQFSDTVQQYADAAQDVVAFVGDRGVSALERLTTAVYLLLGATEECDDALADRLREIKPHVSPELARDAVERGRSFLTVRGAPR